VQAVTIAGLGVDIERLDEADLVVVAQCLDSCASHERSHISPVPRSPRQSDASLYGRTSPMPSQPLTGKIINKLPPSSPSIAAVNAFDTDGIVKTFAPDAYMTDNRREMGGWAAESRASAPLLRCGRSHREAVAEYATAARGQVRSTMHHRQGRFIVASSGRSDAPASVHASHGQRSPRIEAPSSQPGSLCAGATPSHRGRFRAPPPCPHT
jgi:hypothetical protein